MNAQAASSLEVVPRATLESIREGLSIYFIEDHVYEARAICRDGKVEYGFFDSAETMAKAVYGLTRHLPDANLYITQNPVNPALLARAQNRFRQGKTGATSDKDVVRRKRLILDIDPERPSGISSTDEERCLAEECAETAMDTLRHRFSWTNPILVDSGNGFHLVYEVDLPNDEPSKQLIENVIKAAHDLFSATGVHVDQTLFNAARIIKVPGTVAKKGDSIPARPHRLARIIYRPTEAPFVSVEQLSALAALAPKPEPKSSNSSSYHAMPHFDLAAFLQKHGIDHSGPKPHDGGEKFILEACPFDPDHKAPDAAVFRSAEGRLGFKCLHNSCSDKRWREFREHLEPPEFRRQGIGAVPNGRNGIVEPSNNAWLRAEPGWSAEPDDQLRRADSVDRDQLTLDNKKSKKSGRSTGDEQGKESQATRLIGMINEVEFSHTPEGALFATFPAKNHRETHTIRSKAFRIYLQRRYYAETGSALGSKGLSDALGVFEGMALHDGARQEVFCRIAQHGEDVYIDLGDPDWRAIAVTPEGWDVVSDYPVKFRRAKGMMELPVPVKNDPAAETHFRQCLNVKTEADFALVQAWVLGALRPTGPYPVMWLTGPQGSAKTTTSKVFRQLLDPNQAAMRSLPKEERDFMIAASNGRLLALDNMSHLPDWASDSLCRIATGGGFATRELYSDTEETLFNVMCPVILNGIDEVMTRGDLIDRTVIVQLAEIPEDKRLPEKEFWSLFEQYRPGILGYFLNALQAAMSNVASVKLDRLPRMADFAQFVTAAEESFGWSPGYFLEIYDHNRAEANSIALDASLVAQNIKAFLEQLTTGNYQRVYQLEGQWGIDEDNSGVSTWTGTATALLRNLNRLVTDEERRSKSWPKDPRSLSASLRRLVTNLKADGLAVDFSRAGVGRDIQISHAAQ